MSFYSILVTVLAALLVAFSAGQLGLSAYMVHYWLSRQNRTFVWQTVVSAFNIYWLPNINLTRSYILQLVTGIFGIIIGVVLFGVLVTNRPLTFVGTGKRAPRIVTWPLTTIILAFLLFALALSSLVVSFYDNAHYGAHTIVNSGLCTATHTTSLSSNCYGLNQVYNRFTMEGWACRFLPIYGTNSRYPNNDARTVLSRTCRIGYLSRWWTVAPMLITIFIVIGALFEMRRRNIVDFNERKEQNTASYSHGHSFSSAATETPLSPNGTLPQYSAAPELGDRAVDRHETGGKQVIEVPEKAPYDEMPADKHQVYCEMSANRSHVAVGNQANTAETKSG